MIHMNLKNIQKLVIIKNNEKEHGSDTYSIKGECIVYDTDNNPVSATFEAKNAFISKSELEEKYNDISIGQFCPPLRQINYDLKLSLCSYKNEHGDRVFSTVTMKDEDNKYDIIKVKPKFKVGDRVDWYTESCIDREILNVNVGKTISGNPYISYEIKDGIMLKTAFEHDLCSAKKYVIDDEV